MLDHDSLGVRGMQEAFSALWRTKVGAFVMAVLGLLLGIVGLLKDPLAGAIVFASLIIAGTLLGVYGLVLRVKLGDPLEVISGEDLWDLHDPCGRRATLMHRRRYRVMHDGTFAVRDMAHADGDLSPALNCGPEPFRAVDTFTADGYKNTIISLGQTQQRNDEIELYVERTYADSFRESSEYVRVTTVYQTIELKIRVLFPEGRPPKNPRLIEVSSWGRPQPLQVESTQAPRQELVVCLRKPKRGRQYTVSWDW